MIAKVPQDTGLARAIFGRAGAEGLGAVPRRALLALLDEIARSRGLSLERHG